MKKINYSEFDLSGFTVRELQRICRYYGLEYTEEEEREGLIQKILSFNPNELVERYVPHHHPLEESFYSVIYPSVVVEPPVIKSVRIQRIEESLKKG